MKALSVKQPFAEFIATGEKDIEMRTWRTDYRGPILICASSKGVLSKPRDKDLRAEFEAEFPDGVAVCVVDLADIVPYPSWKENLKQARDFAMRVGEKEFCEIFGEEFNPSDVEYEGFAWMLKNPRRVTSPFPVKGKLHLFEVEYEE